MSSVTIPTPSLEALQCFCSKHTVHLPALFKLSWALILHCYFDATIMTLRRDSTQQPEQETVLLHSSAKDVDSSLLKIWSRLRILWNGCGVHDNGEGTTQGDREVIRFMDISETADHIC